jgi:uncharacterized membrane protein YesL
MRERKWPAPVQVIVSALWDWWDAWVILAVMNLAWELSWLTIVLGPPTTFGLYSVTNRLAHGESLGLGGLVEGARRYALQSWLWMLLNLFAGFLLYANLWFSTSFEANLPPIRQAVALFLGVMWLTVQFYTLPYLMEQEQKSLWVALRNGLFTVLAAPGYTFVVASVAAFIAILSVRLVFPLLLGGPCLIATLGSRAVQERLETFSVRERGRAHEESGGEE